MVSIIIPVYNGSNYLREAIESALHQTYQNIEIIVVNDGSMDNEKTEQIALSYGNKIKYLRKENGGVATALNMGIEYMNGTYFSWLSHDDVYYPQKIQSQIEYLVSHGDNGTILYSDYDIIDYKSRIISKIVLDHDLLIQKPLYAILKRVLSGCSLLIPKDAFTKCGVFDTNLKFTQDYDLWLRMFRDYNFKHMKKTLIQSRVHEKQQTKIHNKGPKEGNNFWYRTVEGLQDYEILQCEKTKMLFYVKMALSLKNSPYLEAYERCKDLAYLEGHFSAFILMQYYLVQLYFKRKLKNIILKFYRRNNNV